MPQGHVPKAKGKGKGRQSQRGRERVGKAKGEGKSKAKPNGHVLKAYTTYHASNETLCFQRCMYKLQCTGFLSRLWQIGWTRNASTVAVHSIGTTRLAELRVLIDRHVTATGLYSRSTA